MLSCSYDPGLNALTSTGGDAAEFVFNSPSPVVDLFCNGGFIASVNANSFDFVDQGSGTSALTVNDRAHGGTTQYSISGGPFHTGQVSLNSLGRSVRFAAVGHVTLKTGTGSDSTTVISDVTTHRLDNFPLITVDHFISANNLISIDETGYPGGEGYRIWENKLSTSRLGDRIFFPSNSDLTPVQLAMFTGSGSDTIGIDGLSARLSIMPSLSLLRPGGGNDTLVLNDSGSAAFPHHYSFSEVFGIVNGRIMANYDTSLENIYLTTGNSDDNITVGSSTNTLANVPVFRLLGVGGGNNLLTIQESGIAADGLYSLSESRLSVRFSDRVFFPTSPENNPLLQVNLNTGAGNNTVVLQSSNNRLSALPYFGLTSGLGQDHLVLYDTGNAPGAHDYRFSQFAMSDFTVNRARAFYDGSVERVTLKTNNGLQNRVEIGSTNQRIDEGIPLIFVDGRTESISLNDRGYSSDELFRIGYSSASAQRRGDVVQYTNTGAVYLSAGAGNDTLVVSNGATLNSLPRVFFSGFAGFDYLQFDDSAYTPGDIYRLTDAALYFGGGRSGGNVWR